MLKRLFDLILSLVLLIAFAPVMMAIALMIRVKMGSPIIFQQQRPGLKGKAFFLYKFRTMSNTVDGQGDLLEDEQRLTVLGRLLRKYSLDELPQLLNVIKGELSFVGPRPLLMAYLECYSVEQDRRHEVKPGITGWAQINGRNAITWEEKFTFDVWYVDNQRFWLDIKILGMTLIKVLKSEGINQGGSATMSEFMGSERKK